MAERLLVYGGRTFGVGSAKTRERHALWDALDAFAKRHELEVVIHGAAKGADELAGVWAAQAGVPVEAYPADWEQHGKAAGPIRNQEMLEQSEPTVAIECDGGKGTADMRRRLLKAEVPAFLLVVGERKLRRL